MKKKVSLVLAMAVLGVALSGCVVALGNKGDGMTGKGSGQVTLGQQLLDLKKARDEGAIAEDDYIHEKNKLLGKQKK